MKNSNVETFKFIFGAFVMASLTISVTLLILYTCFWGRSIQAVGIIDDSDHENLTEIVIDNKGYSETVIEESSYDYVIYDISLSEDLQKYTYDLCEEYNVPYEMVLSMMYVESTFRGDLISKTQDYGIMQINYVNHDWLEDELGITDFTDNKQNILCGIYILSELVRKYDNEHTVLMAYNMGEYGAQKLFNQGVYSSNYSRKIVGFKNNLLTEGKLFK